MSIGSVSVDVVPDASGFAEKLKAKLSDLNVKVGVDLDDKGAKARLDELGRERSAKLKVVVADEGAKARLKELSRTRFATIKANVDKSSVSQAKSSLSGITSELFSLKGGIVALGPALIPVTAAVAGLAGALASPLIAAGGGLGIFGAITVGALAKAKKDAKDIADLNKKATAATDPKAAAAFSKQADALMKSLPKAEQAFLRAKGSISKGFDELLAKSGGAVFGPLTKGAMLLGSVLPRLSPVVDAFGAAISDMLDQLGQFSRSSGFTSVITFLSTTGVSAFKQLASISKNVAVGLGGMVAAFSPLGTTVLGSLDKLTARFAAFGQNAGSSSGFARFMSYVRTVGPQVGQTIRDVSVAVGHLVVALAPQGSTMLGIIDGLARGIAKMSPGKIAAIAGAVGALGLATGKFSPLTSLTLLVSAVSYAYKHSSAFHRLADGAVRFASAINSLPQGVKIAVGVVGGAAVLKRSGGVGGVAGAATKLIGGGVQKVFVTNPGFGGVGGPGGKVPPIIPGGAAGAAEKAGAGAAEKAGIAATTAALAGKFLPKLLNFAGHVGVGTFASGRSAPSLGEVGPAKGSRGASADPKTFLALSAAFNHARVDATSFNGTMSKLDSQFSSVAKHNPDKALRDVQAAAKKAGVPVRDLGIFLPRTAKALGDLGAKAAAAKANVPSLFKQFSSGASKAASLSSALNKAGITTKDYGKKLRTLPAYVRTQVTTPGAVTSRSQVKALAKQFGLTPRQVKTLMELSGINKALQDAARARAAYASIPRYIHTQISVSRSAKNTSLNKPRATAPGEFADGGWITGPGTSRSDSIPAMLSNGEFVVNAAAAARNSALLLAINGNTARTADQRYATGGPVVSGSNPSTQRFVLDAGGGVTLTGHIDSRVKGHAGLAAALTRSGTGRNE